MALVITSIVWGSTWVVAKIAVKEIPALQLSAIRQCIGGSLLVGFFLLIKRKPLPSLLQFRWLSIMAVIMFVSANGLSTWSIKYIPAGLGALLGALYPLSVFLIEKFLFKTNRLTPLTLIGLLLGIGGIGLVFYESGFGAHGENFGFGVFLSLVAMLSWSVGTILIARNKTQIDPYYGVGWQMLISSIILFIITETSMKTLPLADISSTVWGCIIYLVIFGSLIAFIAFIYSMKVLKPDIASLYAYINPLVAMIGSHFIIDEPLSAFIIWGSIITLAGVYLVNLGGRRSARKDTELTESDR